MIEMSRRPPIAMCSVRGIGVAVSVSTSTCVRSSFSRSLWRDAEALLLVDDEQAEVLEAHVARQQPVRADDDVDLALAERRDGLLLLGLACGSATAPRRCTGKSAKRSEKVTKCCSASTVVGASTATCLPPSTASSAARSATSVLP